MESSQRSPPSPDLEWWVASATQAADKVQSRPAMNASRQYRAGQTVEDHCRSCHEDRIHTVIVVDAHAQPLRVACDFCRSEHNYRGGPRSGPTRSAEAR